MPTHTLGTAARSFLEYFLQEHGNASMQRPNVDDDLTLPRRPLPRQPFAVPLHSLIERNEIEVVNYKE